MTFDFSAWKTSPQADQLDAETQLFKGNLWVPRGKDTNRIFRQREFLKRTRDKEGPQAARRYARKLAARDIYYLAHQVLGFKDLYEPFHGDLCKFIETTDEAGDSTLIEAARGHFKSSLATTARSIRWMIQDSWVTIGLGSATLKDSRPFGRDIRGLLEKCVELRLLFPDIFYWEPRKESPMWREEEFVIRREGHIREATVTLFGVEDDLPTGRHFRKLLIDDAINKDNVGTPERIKKIQMNAELLNPLKVRLEDPIHWVGTPYHAHDYYTRLEKMESIKVYIRAGMEGGQPTFPTQFTKAKLEQLRVDHGNYLFDTQYMMRRIDPSDMKFKKEWLKYDEVPIMPGQPGFVFFVNVDPASARRKESDFTSMNVIGMDWNWNFHWVDGVHDKIDPLQRIEAFFHLCRKWKAVYASYETIGFQKTDEFWIQRKMREDNYYVPVWCLDKHKVNKDERIMGLQPIMAAGRFFVPRKMPYERKWVNPDDGFSKSVDLVEQAIIEMGFYPMGTHDDILDGLTQGRAIVYAGFIPRPTEPKWEISSAYGRKKVPDSDYNPMAH